MKKKIKMVWNFSGLDAIKIANHHIIHLREYMVLNNITMLDEGTEKVNEYAANSYIIIDSKNLEKVKNDLKPHQGFLV